MAVIEVKLARNFEARRAVVAQVLAYAEVLHGLSLEGLETEVLAQHLGARGYASLVDAARPAEQAASFDEEAFTWIKDADQILAKLKRQRTSATGL